MNQDTLGDEARTHLEQRLKIHMQVDFDGLELVHRGTLINTIWLLNSRLNIKYADLMNNDDRVLWNPVDYMKVRYGLSFPTHEGSDNRTRFNTFAWL